MAQAVQRVIHTRAGEQRQRLRACAAPWCRWRCRRPSPRGRAGRTRRGISCRRSALSALDDRSRYERKMHWIIARWLPTSSVVPVFQQQAELLKVVVAVEIGPRQRRSSGRRAMHEAAGERISARATVRRVRDPSVAWTIADVSPRRMPATIPQMRDGGVVDKFDLGQGWRRRCSTRCKRYY